VHFELEVLEDRIQLGIDQVRVHPIMAIAALPDFNPNRLSVSERRKQTQYTEEASHEICPSFWEPRPWDREEDRMSEADSNALRERMTRPQTRVRPARGRRLHLKMKDLFSSSDEEFKMRLDREPPIREPRPPRRSAIRTRSSGPVDPTPPKPPLPIEIPSLSFVTESSGCETDGEDF
jgi:hypothetical protein